MSAPIIKVENFKPSGDPNKDIRDLLAMLGKIHADLYSRSPDGATGPLDSTKTATVKNGIIVNIQ